MSTWLSEDWNYRKSHVVNPETGAGTNYPIRVKTMYTDGFCEEGYSGIDKNQFSASDIDSEGNIYVAWNYHIYKSVDHGKTFTDIYTITAGPTVNGLVFLVYVDSRDYVFVSALQTDRLYRSIDGGTTFTEVIDLNRVGDKGSILAMTEDDNGDLYATEYNNDGYVADARLYKSTDEGASWTIINTWSTGHLHFVWFNSYNKYLYLATAEPEGGGTEYSCIYRSKDYGSTWQLVINSQGVTTYGYVTGFGNDNYVYLGQDNAFAANDIQRFEDDGKSQPFTPVDVWVNPVGATTPIMGMVKVGDYLVATTSRELDNGTIYLLKTSDGVTWTTMVTKYATADDAGYCTVSPHAPLGYAFCCFGLYNPIFITSVSYHDVVFLEGHCKSDFGDIRFTNSSNEELSYWLEDKTDSDKAIFWVKIEASLETDTQGIFIYYGNSDATTTSDASNVFSFWDDFLGASLDVTKWSSFGVGSIVVADSILTLSAPAASGFTYILSLGSYGLNYAIRSKFAMCSGGADKIADNGFAAADGSHLVTFGRVNTDWFAVSKHSGTETTVDLTADSPTADTYYTYEVRRVSAAAAGYVRDDQLRVTITTNVPTEDLLLYMGVASTVAGEPYQKMDWLLVRKYVSPEPMQISWGAEEQYTTSKTITVFDGPYTSGTTVEALCHPVYHKILRIKGFYVLVFSYPEVGLTGNTLKIVTTRDFSTFIDEESYFIPDTDPIHNPQPYTATSCVYSDLYDVFHVAFSRYMVGAHAIDYLYYVAFRIEEDGSIVWLCSPVNIPELPDITSPDSNSYPTIELDTTGRPWIVYCHFDDVTFLDKIEAIRNDYVNGTTWETGVTKTLLSGPITTARSKANIILKLLDGKNYFIYNAIAVSTSGYLYGKMYDGSTWSDADTIATAEATNGYGIGPQFDVIANGDNMYLIALANDVLSYYEYTYGSGWSLISTYRAENAHSPTIYLDSHGDRVICYIDAAIKCLIRLQAGTTMTLIDSLSIPLTTPKAVNPVINMEHDLSFFTFDYSANTTPYIFYIHIKGAANLKTPSCGI